jgi:exonuclease SbcD
MRILHTSDWHLGVSAEQSPREEEHVLFLDWLYEELASREIEVLVHGGDVFHHVQPSARSQTLYYQFLARCVSLPKLRQIVIVGGNHDSASRLDAPSELLDALEVRVVGGLFKDDESWDRCICPIVDDDGNVELVILSLPSIHESRLPIRTTGKNA